MNIGANRAVFNSDSVEEHDPTMLLEDQVYEKRRWHFRKGSKSLESTINLRYRKVSAYGYLCA